MAYLTVQRIGSRRIRTRDLSAVESLDIGRASDCDLALNDTAVSRHHCIVEQRSNGQWRVRDRDSRHGFKLNHVRSSDAILQDGDLVRIGKYHITFHDGDPESCDDDTEPSLADETTSDDSATSLVPMVAEAERERILSLEREIKQNQADRESAQRETQSICIQVEELTRERGELLDRIERLEREAAATDRSTNGGQDALSMPSDELKLLRVQLAGARDDREAEREKRDIVEQEKDELVVRLDELQTAYREQADLATTIDEITVEHREARDQLARELDEFRALQDSISANLTELVDREATWKNDESDLRVELDSAMKRVTAAESDLEAVRQDKQSLTSQIEDLNSQLEDTVQKFDQQRAAILGECDEAVQRSTQLAKQTEDLTAAAESTLELQREHADLAERNAQLEAALAGAEKATADAEERAARISADLTRSERSATEDEGNDEASVALAEAQARANAAERRVSFAHHNLDQYKDRFKQLAADRELVLARLKIFQSQLRKANAEIKRIRAEAREREAILSEYIRRVFHDDAAEASVVELTDEEIRRAQAAGATILEVDGA